MLFVSLPSFFDSKHPHLQMNCAQYDSCKDEQATQTVTMNKIPFKIIIRKKRDYREVT